MEQKIANKVAVRWLRCLPCPYIYIKSSSPELRMPWGPVFAQIIRDGRSTKVAKMMVLHWLLTFLWRGQLCFPMHLYGPIHLYGKNVEIFKQLLWSLWASVAQISSGASLGQGNERVSQNSHGPFGRWQPCPYMVKTFENLLLQI